MLLGLQEDELNTLGLAHLNLFLQVATTMLIATQVEDLATKTLQRDVVEPTKVCYLLVSRRLLIEMCSLLTVASTALVASLLHDPSLTVLSTGI